MSAKKTTCEATGLQGRRAPCEGPLVVSEPRGQPLMWCELRSGLMLKQMFFLQLVPTGLTMLYTMTEREADNFGIFYREVLSTTKGWWVSPCLSTLHYNSRTVVLLLL